ncbi:MAG: stage III sporulation protein AD [Clostridia bacterium]
MTIFKIIGFGIIAVSLIIILKNQKPEIALICVIASSIIMLAFIFDELKSVISLINSLILNSSIDSSYIKIILKVIGISYLVEFGKDICKDAGESAIANKIEMAGKVIVVSVSIPVIASLIEIVSQII